MIEMVDVPRTGMEEEGRIGMVVRIEETVKTVEMVEDSLETIEEVTETTSLGTGTLRIDLILTETKILIKIGLILQTVIKIK